jgi:CheY-like chemotaxis protein
MCTGIHSVSLLHRRVLLDINLDGKDSFAIADTLIARNIPFIFVTGYDPRKLPTCYQTQVVLEKPFSNAILLRMLASVLEEGPRKPGVMVRSPEYKLATDGE